MANLQELMQMVVASTARPAGVFVARITPKVGEALHLRVKARDAGRARLVVQAAARRRFPHGFTFSVRPA